MCRCLDCICCVSGEAAGSCVEIASLHSTQVCTWQRICLPEQAHRPAQTCLPLSYSLLWHSALRNGKHSHLLVRETIIPSAFRNLNRECCSRADCRRETLVTARCNHLKMKIYLKKKEKPRSAKGEKHDWWWITSHGFPTRQRMLHTFVRVCLCERVSGHLRKWVCQDMHMCV